MTPPFGLTNLQLFEVGADCAKFFLYPSLKFYRLLA
jgi:hypothetical protein